jgi:hypothetical protein
MMMRKNPRFDSRREKGAALVIAIVSLAILTVIGIALMFITSTESMIAANEWAINRAYYASDGGVRWAAAQLTDPQPFLTRAEFRSPPDPFGAVLFPMPSHRHGTAFFSGDPEDDDINVTVMSPSLLGRRPSRGSIINERERGHYRYAYEVRSNASQTTASPQYAKPLVADIEVGPLPARLPF